MECVFNKKIQAKLEAVSALVVETIQFLSIKNLDLCIYDIEIALAEGLTNVVKHAYQFDASKTIELFLYMSATEIKIDILDEAEPYELPLDKKLIYDINDVETLPEGGMGIFLMNRCMNTITFSRKNNKNILSMKKKYES